MYSKPSWLSSEEFWKFLEIYDNYPICKRLSDKCLSNGGVIAPSDFTVDHITPRSANGTNDLSNLQPLCRVCNSYKNNNDDRYWSGDFYFDRQPNLDKYLTSQKQFAHDLITQDYREWFKRPWSQINRVLYILAWFTGAGKTHAITSIPFALNWVKNTQQTNDVRVARVLVLVKEEAIRDQLKQELETETVKYGICDVSPRVLAMRGRSWNISTYENYDIVVACIQQLWQTGDNGEPVKDLAHILSEFQVIFFDEIHYAYNRVQTILQNAYKSLCFGLTATPMDAAGNLIDSCVLLSTYTWEDGNKYDANLKNIPRDVDNLVDEIDFEDWRGYRHGESIRDTDEAQGHQYQIETAKRVANQVVAYVKDLDLEIDRINRGEIYPHLANHRVQNKQYSFLPDLTYYAHALIKVDSIETAHIIENALNQQFENDRNTYPKEQGYIADVVHSGQSNGYEIGRNPRPLTDSHPWLQLKHKGKIGARFLVAVEIGREGVNNPFCVVAGLACPVNSLVDVIQRPIGRSVRAVKENKENHVRVPTSRLDTIKIITHRVYGNLGIVQQALDYVLNMEDRLARLRTIDDLIKGDSSTDLAQDDPGRDFLDEFTKIKIIDYVGRDLLGDKIPSLDDILGTFINTDDSPKRKQRVVEWSKLTFARAPSVKKFVLTDNHLETIDIVRYETPKVIVPDDELISFIKLHKPHIASITSRIPQDNDLRIACLELRRDWIEKFYATPLKSKENESLSKIRSYLASRVINLLSDSLTDSKKVYGIVGNAMKDILGIPHEIELQDRSRYDIPQVHSLLRRPNISRRVIRYTISELVKSGYCPSLREVVGNE